MIGVLLGLYQGYIRVILGLYWDDGKQNGTSYLGFRVFDCAIVAIAASFWGSSLGLLP